MSFINILKSLIWIWPFLSEMFFAGKPFKTILKEHWVAFALLFFLALSLVVNYISVAKIYRIASTVGQQQKQVPKQTQSPGQLSNKKDSDNDWIVKEIDNIYKEKKDEN